MRLTKKGTTDLIAVMNYSQALVMHHPGSPSTCYRNTRPTSFCCESLKNFLLDICMKLIGPSLIIVLLHLLLAIFSNN
jgi:hypothetical protein